MADAAAYADWIVKNQDKQGSPEFETVAAAYKQARAQPKLPADPFAGMSTDQLKKRYRDAQVAGEKDLLPKISDAFVAREANDASKSTLGGIGHAVDTTIRNVAGGVPIIGGALDEANAGLSALGGGNYEEALDYNRSRDRWSMKQMPGVTIAGNITGGVASGLGAVRALGAGVGTGVPLVQKALYGAAIGAPVGAADFFARGEGDVGNRSVDAGIGAVAGGVLGAAAPAVGAGLNAGARRVMDYLTSDQALRRLGISRNAANVLIRQLGTDDTITATGAARIRQGGPDAMLADAGPAARNLLDTSLQRSGPGATAAREAVEQRAAGANRQLTNTLDNTLGPSVGVETQQEAIRTGTAAARGATYDAAYATPIDYTSPGGNRIAGLWARVSQARRRAANALLEEAGELPIEDGALPTVRQIDYVTRALNDVAQSGEGQGALGAINQVGLSAQRLSRGLRESLRDAVPEYARALDTAADPIRRVQATEFGSTILNPNVTREQVTRELAGMTGPERQQVRSGLRAAIDDIAANMKQIASDPNIESRELRSTLDKLTSRAAREKVAFALNDPAAVRAFYGQVGRSLRALELKASVATNSRTYGRSATDAQVKAQMDPGVIGSIMEGSPVQAAKKFWQSITQMSPERRLAAEDRLYGEIANALTNVRGRAAERRLIELMRAVRAQAANRQAPRAIGQIGQSGFAGAPAAALNQTLPDGR